MKELYVLSKFVTALLFVIAFWKNSCEGCIPSVADHRLRIQKKNKCHFLPPIKYHIPFVCNLYLRNECNTNTTVYCSTYHLFWQLSFIIYAIVLHFVFPLCFVTNYASENCVYIGYILKLAYVLLQGPIYLYTKIHSNRNRRSYFRL